LCVACVAQVSTAYFVKKFRAKNSFEHSDKRAAVHQHAANCTEHKVRNNAYVVRGWKFERRLKKKYEFFFNDQKIRLRQRLLMVILNSVVYDRRARLGNLIIFFFFNLNRSPNSLIGADTVYRPKNALREESSCLVECVQFFQALYPSLVQDLAKELWSLVPNKKHRMQNVLFRPG